MGNAVVSAHALVDHVESSFFEDDAKEMAMFLLRRYSEFTIASVAPCWNGNEAATVNATRLFLKEICQSTIAVPIAFNTDSSRVSSNTKR